MIFPFAYPLVLLLLVVPVLLLGWTWNRPGRRVVLPFDHGRQRSGGVAQFFLNVFEMTPALVLAIVILVLAGPQRSGDPKTKRVLSNIEFCIDVSGSMMSQFGEGTRYDASMKAINSFLDYRQGDAFGLTFFGNNTLKFIPLTTDTSAFRCAPPFMKPEVAPPWMGGTMIGKALLACKDVLVQREEGDRMIVLISDGESFDLSNGADKEIADALKKERITVFMIHTAETEIPAQIVTITHITDGAAFAPDDPDALKTVFERIDQMKKAKIEKVGAETIDNYFPYCLAGLILLGLSGLGLLGLRYTPW